MPADQPYCQTILIRSARTDDAPALVAYMTGLTNERLDTISTREPSSLEEEREWLLRAKLFDGMMILLATHEQQIIGRLELSAGLRPDDHHAGRLGMSVARAWRGRGVGRRLLAAAVERARDWPGFCRIELECAPWNTPAIRLYESVGFVMEGRRRKALNLRGHPEDMLLMALTW